MTLYPMTKVPFLAYFEKAFLTYTRDKSGTERKGTERVPPVPFPEREPKIRKRKGTGTQNWGTWERVPFLCVPPFEYIFSQFFIEKNSKSQKFRLRRE